MDKIGLIIIGHGSKLPHNRENLEKLADILRKRSKFKTVEISFMVRNRPTIPEAIESIAKQGVTKIVLVPAFLAPGVHTEQEIPEMIEEKALRALGQDNSEVNQTPDARMLQASNKTFTTSISIVRKALGDALTTVPKAHTPIIERVVHTTADPEFAKLLVINEKAVEAGVAAIKTGAKIITDVKMVKAGINEARVKRFGGRILTYIDDERAVKLAGHESTTRAAAAMRLAINNGVDGSIILIGNAPTAAFELAHAVKQGLAKPALIVATPVGFIGAAESKEVIASLSTPFIIVKGRKGGSAVAVAVFNALLAMAEGKASTSEA
jgi:precorrin-8X/cobalt-precorrin-8 methylmutase